MTDTSTETVRTSANIYDSEPEPTREQLLELIKTMQADWVRLNEVLNATAMHYGWCSTWEEHCHTYNNYFGVLRLVGRAEVEAHYSSFRGHDRDTCGRCHPYLLPGLKRQQVDRDEEKRMALGDLPHPVTGLSWGGVILTA